MQPFAVVVALLAVAALGWLLSSWGRALLRRHGVPTDERDVPDVSRPGWCEIPHADSGDGHAGDGGPGGPRAV